MLLLQLARRKGRVTLEGFDFHSGPVESLGA